MHGFDFNETNIYSFFLVLVLDDFQVTVGKERNSMLKFIVNISLAYMLRII